MRLNKLFLFSDVNWPEWFWDETVICLGGLALQFISIPIKDADSIGFSFLDDHF